MAGTEYKLSRKYYGADVEVATVRNAQLARVITLYWKNSGKSKEFGHLQCDPPLPKIEKAS